MCLCLCRGRGVYWPSPCTIHIQVSDTWTDFFDTFFDIFISMSTDWTSISKECYGQICWGKPDTTGYGNGSTDLPGTYYSSDAPLHCPLSNMLTQSPLLPSYNVHVLGHTWFNLFSILFVLCSRSIVMGHTSCNCYSVYPILKLLDPIFLITKLNQITFHEDNFS